MDISALGEFELIARLTHNLSSRPDVALHVGDDCAVLDLNSDALLLATCDSQVEGTHFTFQFSTPEQIGRKALAVNLSDIAAMGGEPRYALVSLILPPHLPLATLDALYAGLREEADQYKTAIVGGNIAGSNTSASLIIDITLLGTVERGHVLTRGAAQIGDTLLVTGFPGNAFAGLHTLFHPDPRYPLEAQELLRSAYRVPHPRVREGRILSQFGPLLVTAMLDISDGLSGDLAHLCERSHVGARVDLTRLPLSPPLHALAASIEQNPSIWALHGGDAYELLFTVSPGHEQRVIDAIQSATATPVTAIGTTLPPVDGMKLLYPDGHEERLEVHSWDHLKSI